MRSRIALGVCGGLVLGYGVLRLVTQPKISHPRELLEWLVAGVVIHDGFVVPATMALGALLVAVVPPRARRYVQGTLVCAAVVSVPAAVLIYRRGSQPSVKALENQDYALHLVLILALIAGGGLMLYLSRVFRDQRRRQANQRPPEDHVSVTE